MKELILEYIKEKKKLQRLIAKLADEYEIKFIEDPSYIQTHQSIEKVAKLLNENVKEEKIPNGVIEKYFYFKDTRILEV